MEHIYSKVEKDKLLHIVVRKADMTPGRVDVVPGNNFLQCALLNMEDKTTFRPHKHIWKARKQVIIAQESWIVLQGSVKCILYDTDDQIIATPILLPGDASFTLDGGHTYEILADDTLVYEYKTGPYEGQQMDKEFI